MLFISIYVYLWKALYTGKTAVEGYDLNGILTYIVVSQTLVTFQFTLRIARVIEEKVRTGEVVTDLMKPVDFQLMLLAAGAGTSLHTALFIMLPKLLLFYGILSLSLPGSILTLGIFIVSVILGCVILFSIEFLIGILAFWLVEIRGIYIRRDMGHILVFLGILSAFRALSHPSSQNRGGLAFPSEDLFSDSNLCWSLYRKSCCRCPSNPTDLGSCVNGAWAIGIRSCLPKIGHSRRIK